MGQYLQMTALNFMDQLDLVVSLLSKLVMQFLNLINITSMELNSPQNLILSSLSEHSLGKIVEECITFISEKLQNLLRKTDTKLTLLQWQDKKKENLIA